MGWAAWQTVVKPKYGNDSRFPRTLRGTLQARHAMMPGPLKVSYRLARESDALQMAVMSRDLVEVGLGWSWRPHRVLDAIHDRDAVAVAAEVEGLLAGFAIMQFDDTEAHLSLLAVSTRWQRRGLGRGLLQWLESSAIVAGIDLIHLEVRCNNHVAQAFYHRQGYRRLSVLPNYYQSREAAVRMCRRLRQAVTGPP